MKFEMSKFKQKSGATRKDSARNFNKSSFKNVSLSDSTLNSDLHESSTMPSDSHASKASYSLNMQTVSSALESLERDAVEKKAVDTLSNGSEEKSDTSTGTNQSLKGKKALAAYSLFNTDSHNENENSLESKDLFSHELENSMAMKEKELQSEDTAIDAATALDFDDSIITDNKDDVRITDASYAQDHSSFNGYEGSFEAQGEDDSAFDDTAAASLDAMSLSSAMNQHKEQKELELKQEAQKDLDTAGTAAGLTLEDTQGYGQNTYSSPEMLKTDSSNEDLNSALLNVPLFSELDVDAISDEDFIVKNEKGTFIYNIKTQDIDHEQGPDYTFKKKEPKVADLESFELMGDNTYELKNRQDKPKSLIRNPLNSFSPENLDKASDFDFKDFHLATDKGDGVSFIDSILKAETIRVLQSDNKSEPVHATHQNESFKSAKEAVFNETQDYAYSQGAAGTSSDTFLPDDAFAHDRYETDVSLKEDRADANTVTFNTDDNQSRAYTAQLNTNRALSSTDDISLDIDTLSNEHLLKAFDHNDTELKSFSFESFDGCSVSSAHSSSVMTDENLDKTQVQDKSFAYSGSAIHSLDVDFKNSLRENMKIHDRGSVHDDSNLQTLASDIKEAFAADKSLKGNEGLDESSALPLGKDKISLQKDENTRDGTRKKGGRKSLKAEPIFLKSSAAIESYKKEDVIAVPSGYENTGTAPAVSAVQDKKIGIFNLKADPDRTVSADKSASDAKADIKAHSRIQDTNLDRSSDKSQAADHKEAHSAPAENKVKEQTIIIHDERSAVLDKIVELKEQDLKGDENIISMSGDDSKLARNLVPETQSATFGHYDKVIEQSSLHEVKIASHNDSTAPLPVHLKCKLFVRQLIASFFSNSLLRILFPQIALRLGAASPASMSLPLIVLSFICVLFATAVLIFTGSHAFAAASIFILTLILNANSPYHGIVKIVSIMTKKRTDAITSASIVLVGALLFIYGFKTLYIVATPFEVIVLYTLSMTVSATFASTIAFTLGQDPVDSFGQMSKTGFAFCLVLIVLPLYLMLNIIVATSILGTALFVRTLLDLIYHKVGFTASRVNVYATTFLTFLAVLIDCIILGVHNDFFNEHFAAFVASYHLETLFPYLFEIGIVS